MHSSHYNSVDDPRFVGSRQGVRTIRQDQATKNFFLCHPLAKLSVIHRRSEQSSTYSRIGWKCRSLFKSQSAKTHDSSKGKRDGKICITTQNIAWNCGRDIGGKTLTDGINTFHRRKNPDTCLLPEASVKEYNSGICPVKLATSPLGDHRRTYVVWIIPKKIHSLLVIVR